MALERKLLTGVSAEALALQAQLNLWRVDRYCKLLWMQNRFTSRSDTFIGLMDTGSWIIYLAPCFGVTAEECQRALGGAAPKNDGRLMALRAQLAKFENIPNDLRLVGGSTSTEADTAHTYRWHEVKGVYDRGACLVPWTVEKNNFDGHSHAAFVHWIRHCAELEAKPGAGWQSNALGFAVQKDDQGYFVRFASGFNTHKGGAVTAAAPDVFKARLNPDKGNDREVRDMPKEWAQKLVEVLARDLRMGYLKPHEEDNGKFFQRKISRGIEGRTTKYKYLSRLT